MSALEGVKSVNEDEKTEAIVNRHWKHLSDHLQNAGVEGSVV